MGYETSLHLINVKIKPSSINAVKRSLKKHQPKSIGFFLDVARLDKDGFLVFKVDEDRSNPYEPCKGEDTIPALYGKWYEDEEIASWLKKHSEKGSKIVQHSIEADGEAWGWEFDGKGKMRYLELRPGGGWK